MIDCLCFRLHRIFGLPLSLSLAVGIVYVVQEVCVVYSLSPNRQGLCGCHTHYAGQHPPPIHTIRRAVLVMTIVIGIVTIEVVYYSDSSYS